MSFPVFGALNAFLIPVVYLFFPETAGRSLEDMDVVFALAHREGVSPVRVSLRKDVPRAGSKAADEILGLSPASSEARGVGISEVRVEQEKRDDREEA